MDVFDAKTVRDLKLTSSVRSIYVLYRVYLATFMSLGNLGTVLMMFHTFSSYQLPILKSRSNSGELPRYNIWRGQLVLDSADT